MATGSKRRLAFQAETTWGVDPVSPDLKALRTTGGGGIEINRAQLESQELRSDRMIADFRGGNNSPMCSFPFELSMGTFDSFFESALWGTWTADVLKQGNSLKSLVVEEGFLDMGTPQYRRMNGGVVNNMSLNIQPNSLITGTFDLMGKSVTAFSATPFDATVTDASSDTVMDSFTGTLTEGGSPLAYITGLNFTIANNIEEQFAILAADARNVFRFGAGRSRITGTLSAYFEDVTLYNKFVNETNSSLSVVLTSGTKSYTLLFPKVRYTGATKNLTETNIQIDMPFISLYDSVEQTQLKITRDLT